MAKPHLRNGIYYCRLAVPRDLHKALKKKEVWRSLGTGMLSTAMPLFKIAVAEIEEEWVGLREASLVMASSQLPVHKLSRKDAVALSHKVYARTLAEHEHEPGSAKSWTEKLLGIQDALNPSARLPDYKSKLYSGIYLNRPQFVAVRQFGEMARELAAEEGFAPDAEGLTKLSQAYASALGQAYNVLIRNARGDFSPDPAASRFPEFEGLAVNADGPRIDTEDLLTQWKNSPAVYDGTSRTWVGKFRALMKFAEKTDVTKLVTLDIERYRDWRIEQGISPNTVSNGDLAAFRGILGWAANHSKIPIKTNVALGVRQARAKTVKVGLSGYDFEEAELVLRGTLLPVENNMLDTTKAARRWVPWLCAYSGARVREIGQLTAGNVLVKKTPEGREIWCMWITPEDGSTKTHQARVVPLHPHLIEQGFLKYVESRKGLPLFYNPERARGSEQGHRQSQKVGERIAEWIRDDLKITRKIQPNHAWRHRFETEGRRLKFRKDVVNYITGHAQDDTAGDYGDYLVEVLYEAINELPRYLEPRRKSATATANDGS